MTENARMVSKVSKCVIFLFSLLFVGFEYILLKTIKLAYHIHLQDSEKFQSAMKKRFLKCFSKSLDNCIEKILYAGYIFDLLKA